jgi:hypothetical protein
MIGEEKAKSQRGKKASLSGLADVESLMPLVLAQPDGHSSSRGAVVFGLRELRPLERDDLEAVQIHRSGRLAVYVLLADWTRHYECDVAARSVFKCRRDE